MKNTIKKVFYHLIDLTKPIIWRLFEAYDVKIIRHCKAYGQNQLIIEGTSEERKNNIPKSVYFNTRSGKIIVGEKTVFGEDVMLLTGRHINLKEANDKGLKLHHVPESGYDITIGRNCYIGSGAILIGRVSIGDFAVVGAGSVVTKDVPVRVFVAGVPAKPVHSI